MHGAGVSHPPRDTGTWYRPGQLAWGSLRERAQATWLLPLSHIVLGPRTWSTVPPQSRGSTDPDDRHLVPVSGAPGMGSPPPGVSGVGFEDADGSHQVVPSPGAALCPARVMWGQQPGRAAGRHVAGEFEHLSWAAEGPSLLGYEPKLPSPPPTESVSIRQDVLASGSLL